MADAQNRTEGGSIVIVDDDRFLADMYSMKFIQKGFTVETHDSVASALKSLRGGLRPTAVLFDIVMPELNGFDFLRTVKTEKLAEDALLIALTNQNNDSDRSQAESLGAHVYFIKATMIPSEVVTATLQELEKRKKA